MRRAVGRKSALACVVHGQSLAGYLFKRYRVITTWRNALTSLLRLVCVPWYSQQFSRTRKGPSANFHSDNCEPAKVTFQFHSKLDASKSFSSSTMVMMMGCRRPRCSLVLLGWLALAAVSRARLQESASTNETTEPLRVGILNESSSTTANTEAAYETDSVASGRHVAASSSSSSVLASTIVMDEDPCRTSFRHVCDPDKILSSEDIRRLQQELDDYPRTVRCEGKDVDVQVAVALVSKVRMHDPNGEKGGDESIDTCHLSLSCFDFVLLTRSRCLVGLCRWTTTRRNPRAATRMWT
jgi:Modulator of levamisole receptor-1